MAENSQISWTDHTFNPWIGCTKVSAGCANCYAEADFDKRKGFAKWGPGGTRVVTSDANWKKPLKWNKDAAAEGVRKRVFCASLADVFEGPETMPAEAWPKVRAARVRLHHLINETPQLDWLLLTKRPENVRKFAEASDRSWTENMPSNVWLGTSVENQAAADERIPHLLRVPAKVRFLSMEPLLGPVQLGGPTWEGRARGLESVGLPRHLAGDVAATFKPLDGIHWVIVGGESGTGARPLNPAWARSLRDQCKAAGVAFHMKQMGALVEGLGLKLIQTSGKGGGEDIPEDLRVREFPKAVA